MNQPAGEPRAAPLTREQIDVLLGNVLRYGVILCAVIIATGVALGAARPSSVGTTLGQVLPHLLSAEMVEGAGPPSTLAAFLHLSSYADPSVIVSLGLILLILLPVVRVGITILVFLVERDRVYVAITAIVFAVLVFGLAFGKAL